PQSQTGFPDDRGSRVDIEVVTDDNEIVIYELQILHDPSLPKRNILAASHRIFDSAAPGDSYRELLKKTPKIIQINILCYNIRGDNADIVQPIQMLFTKPPHTVADDTITQFDVQLPRFIKLIEEDRVDYKNALHCWLMLFWKSHELKKSPQEVLKMYPQLQEFADANTGYGDFCQRYNLVAADRTTLKRYAMWINEALRREGEIAGAIEEKDAEIAEKDAEIAEKDAEIAGKDAEIVNKDAEIAGKDAEIVNKDAEIADLKAQLKRFKDI
ncbi:MAG: PD-(D/E)XK nuclease family transposase, partial [Gracilibacteraceae bacterium]|nr:PD-(D/E)XK nuclease family transposase [Gracilibacteraceae bacterium]